MKTPLGVVFVVLASLAPLPASSQPHSPASPALAPEVRASLSKGVADAPLLPWQREFMLHLTRGRAPSAASPAAARALAAPARAALATDGSWAELVALARSWPGAVYDPLRDRMVVFGGAYYSEGSSFYRNDVWSLSLTGTPGWTRLTPTGAPPSGRYGHSAIYDPVRDRMVVFGGFDALGTPLADVWALSLAGTPTWTALTPNGAPPSGRFGHSAIYDPLGDRMVVFGGTDGFAYRNDAWTLWLAGTPTWTKLIPAGTPPGGRDLHSAIYDPVRDRMVVFGGSGSVGLRSDVWALSLAGTAAWTALSPTGTAPVARCFHSAVYDPARDRMVLFGGYGSSYPHPRDDVWALSLTGTPAWRSLAPAGAAPEPRYSQAAVYDAPRERMVVFGGYDGAHYSDETWALSLADTPTWTDLAAVGTPPVARMGQTAIHDPARARMVVFGGYDASGSPLGDLWSLSLAGAPSWLALTPAGTPPGARGGHCAVLDPVRERMLVMAGFDGVSDLNDVWAVSLVGAPTWTQLTPTGTPPSGREAASAVYDPANDRVVMFGGFDGASCLNDAWELSLGGAPAWTELVPDSAPPSPRQGHSAIYDPTTGRMVLFAGWDGISLFDDIWTLSLTGTPTWRELTPDGTLPTGREAHSAIYDPVRGVMVVFGGFDGVEPYLNDVWTLSLAGAPAWTELLPTGLPPIMRNLQSAVYDMDHDRLVVFGGYGGSYPDVRNDVWALTWPPLAGVGDPAARPLLSDLRPPLPNPSNGNTTLTYSLAQAGRVHLGVYDASGRLVRTLLDGESRAGVGSVVWDGTGEAGSRLGAGVYFMRMAGPMIRATRKVVLLR